MKQEMEMIEGHIQEEGIFRIIDIHLKENSTNTIHIIDNKMKISDREILESQHIKAGIIMIENTQDLDSFRSLNLEEDHLIIDKIDSQMSSKFLKIWTIFKIKEDI